MFEKIVIASHNAGKVSEIAQLLNPLGIDVRRISEFSTIEPEETGTTFEENALLKAEHGVMCTGLPCLADDSGLCVDALDGQPGIYTARLGGAEKNFSVGIQRLEDLLIDHPNPAAHFVCVLALQLPNGASFLFRGDVHGHLTFPRRGSYGHGFDSIFVKKGHTKTFAELSTEIKNQESARAIAFEKFLAHIRQII